MSLIIQAPRGNQLVYGNVFVIHSRHITGFACKYGANFTTGPVFMCPINCTLSHSFAFFCGALSEKQRKFLDKNAEGLIIETDYVEDDRI